MLEFYEQELGFEVCELNYTYYRLPDPFTMERLARRVSNDFEFTVKASKEMTHEIWADDKRKVIKDIKGIKAIFKTFVQGVEPLAARRKLGAILIQFPSFFKCNEQNIEYLERTRVLP